MRIAFILLISLLLPNGARSAEPFPQPSGSDFQVTSRLKANVDFWIRIYSHYGTREGVVHDSRYIDKVYEVLDFRGTEGRTSRQVLASKRKWKSVLLSLHRKQSKPAPLTEDEAKVFELYRDVPDSDKFLAAAHRKRVRFQLGQKDRFEEGLRLSGRYLVQMEEIFRQQGLPLELTRLPFVESSFNTRARSKVGASGIWQFMRSTGRHFLRISDAVDERNDPILATRAAAELLKLNYQSLGSWPLAVTAYNHGRQGMMRAVRRVGSESLDDLIEGYRSRSFGFASSNFFACLLAAIEVERGAEKYFGKVQREPLHEFLEAPLPEAIRFRDLVKFMSLNPKEIMDLNPAFSSRVFAGEVMIPAGYLLRVPFDGKSGKDSAVEVFLAGYREIPVSFKKKSPGLRRAKANRSQ